MAFGSGSPDEEKREQIESQKDDNPIHSKGVGG
jgi:hypothetical protein